MGDIADDLDSLPSPSYDDEPTVCLAQAQYSESISIGITKKEPASSYVSFYDVKVRPRCKSTVEFNVRLSPVGYQNKMIVYRDSTRKKFKNVVHYQPRNRPVRFAETQYLRQKKDEQTFVSYLDVGGIPDRKWYESKLQLIPVTHSCSQVANMEMNLNSDGEESEYDDSVFKEHVRMRMDALGDGFSDSLRLSSRSFFSKLPIEPQSFSTSVFVHGQNEQDQMNGHTEHLHNGYNGVEYLNQNDNGHSYDEEDSFA